MHITQQEAFTMSKETISEILTKAITNKEYRDLLFSSPDAVVAGYDLTEEEVSALKKIDRATFDAAAVELESRVMKAGRDLSGLDVIMLQCNQIDGSSFIEALNLNNLFEK
jgi:hypothetical protein